jgi:hypothetical protein
VLAPHEAILRTTYTQSVPIAIAKKYSHNSIDEKFAFVKDNKVNVSVIFASKYILQSWLQRKPLPIANK